MENCMKDINFIKNIDNLGRIVIPMDIRRKLQINTGDVLSITCNDKDILLTKYSTLDDNFKIIEIIKYFIEIFQIKVILMNKECVLYSNVVNIGSKLGNNIKLFVKNGNSIKSQSNEFVFGENKVNGIYNMLPIVTNEGVIGSIVVFGDINEKGYEMCTLLSKIIMLELNIS